MGENVNRLTLQQLCLRFNVHFPVGPGLATPGMSPFWISLALMVMEVVVTYKTCIATVK